jgi:hypothetical protein
MLRPDMVTSRSLNESSFDVHSCTPDATPDAPAHDHQNASLRKNGAGLCKPVQPNE